MGERYWISGVQLGMLKAYFELNKVKEAEKLRSEIEEHQFIGRLDPETESLEIVSHQ